MSSQLEKIFNIDSSTGLPSGASIPAIFQEASGNITVEIDVQKANQLNAIVQTKLFDLFNMAADAASAICLSIAHGDSDARTIEGAAKLVESATKAMSEINHYNMFLQEKIVDDRASKEIERLQGQIHAQRTMATREEVLAAIREGISEKLTDEKLTD